MFLVPLLAACVAVTAAAQFASGVSLVEVYASVTDAQGNAVTGLSASDFRLEEDGQLQSISQFAAGNFPLSVGIAIDRSFSISRDRLRMMTAAARAFVTALRQGDAVMVIAIGSQAETVAPLSSDRRPAWDALDLLQPWGTTPLYDAAAEAVDAIQSASGRRALIVLSDGTDRYSRTTAADLLTHIRATDVLIYPISVGKQRVPVFAEIATVTGGRSFAAADQRALERALTAIASDLRLQYLIGYVPSRRAETPGWRSIRVTVNRPDVRVRARDGYVAK